MARRANITVGLLLAILSLTLWLGLINAGSSVAQAAPAATPLHFGDFAHWGVMAE